MGSVLSYFFGYPDDNTLYPELGMTGRQKRLLKESWQIFGRKPVYTGVTIMVCYFKEYPQYQEVFPAFKDIPLKDLPSNKKFQAHCQNIVSTLNNAFDALDDVDLMSAALHIVGERHGKRGQGRQEFLDLKTVIMRVFQEELGSRFNSELEEIWDKAIDIAFSKIYEGMNDQAKL